MAFADDLLRDAHHLASRGGQKPKQSTFRRAVSTAYYALFHLLVADFVSNWRLTDQRARLGRMFEHRRMSGAVLKLQDKKNPTAVESELQKIISSFAQLQEDIRPIMTSGGSGHERMSQIRSPWRMRPSKAGGRSARRKSHSTTCCRCSAHDIEILNASESSLSAVSDLPEQL